MISLALLLFIGTVLFILAMAWALIGIAAAMRSSQISQQKGEDMRDL